MGKAKELLKRLFPFAKSLKVLVKSFKEQLEKRYYTYIIKKKQQKKLSELKGKEKIKCVILLHVASTFREYLYQLLLDSNRFDIYLVVSPECSHGEENKKKNLAITYKMLKDKGYKNVIMGYDSIKESYLDIKKEINPDIIIYTSPYKTLIGNNNYITNFQDCLNVYIPYFINNTVEYKMAYDELLHNIVWRYYVETKWHKDLSQKYSTNHGRNVVTTGYPGVDRFLDKSYIPSDKYWKIKDRKYKRIIWAPHRTMDPNDEMYYSAFLFIADKMTEFAKKYEDVIQIAFKPHPLMISNLSKVWDKERIDAYYEKWRNMKNTTIVEGEYVDLFLTSDAIIHDSASFITEYLLVNKPALRTYNGRDPKTQFNEFGLACLKHYYSAYTADDVEKFILNVINNNDPMMEERTHFVQRYLLPPDGKLPSEQILKDLVDSIDNGVLYHN